MTPSEQLKLDIRRQKSMAMRFKKPALADMGYENLVEGLRTIIDDCDEIRYFVDNDDGSDGGLMACPELFANCPICHRLFCSAGNRR